jgi:Putative zinc-finger
MTHLEFENLASEYLEERLDVARHAQVEEHLKGCASCRELLSGVRHAIQICRSAEEVMPPPWLMSKIRLATLGEAPTGIAEQVNALLRNFRQPRFAYAVAMTVFSLSLIVNIAGLNLRRLNVQDLNPATWAYRANRAGHLLYARAEKFYDDLRIVYEIESRFRNDQSKSAEQEKKTGKPNSSPGNPASSSDSSVQQMASGTAGAAGQYAQLEPGVQTYEMR